MNNSIRQLFVAAAAFFACSCASADIAVVVHPDNPVSSMTAEQVADAFLGRDASLRPIDLPEAGGLRNWFYSRLIGLDNTQVSILWAKRMDKLAPLAVDSSAEAVRRVAGNRRAIAYVDTRLVDASVKVVLTVPTPEVLDRVRGPDRPIKQERFYWW